MTMSLRKLIRDSYDLCSVCDRRFQLADTVHAGYASDGTSLYVGDCCAAQLFETAGRYYWRGRGYKVPLLEASLWRYLDLAKFIALLRDRTLYFSRADKLGDAWECALGAAHNKDCWDRHFLRVFTEAVRNPPPGATFDKSDEEVQAEARGLLSAMEASNRTAQAETFVSCWHENESESEALWRLYCPPPTPGVAIHTTFSELRKAFDEDLEVDIGRVEYIDFRSQFSQIDHAIFRKRRSLSHECEVRAVFRQQLPKQITGVPRYVNLELLIQEVVLSPFAPAWVESVVKDLMNRYCLNRPVRTSEILIEPFF